MKGSLAKRIAIVGASCVMAVGMCACESAPAGRAPVVNIATSTVPAPTGNRTIPKSAFAGHRPFTGPAVAKFGQTRLELAYEEVVNFAFKTGWDSALIRTDPAHLTFAQFADARSYMTPSCRRAFDAVLVKAMQADRAAITTLEEMVFFGVTGSKGMTPVAQGHVVTDRKFTAASVVLERTHRPARLAVSFAAKANIQLRNAAGTRYTMATGRVMTYLLMPNTGSDRARRPFLIDSWRSKASVTRPALPH